MSKHFEVPTQVVFTFHNGERYERCAGIAYGDQIICGCCGGIFEIEEDIVIEKGLPWVNLCEEICPDEDYGEIEDEEEERVMGFWDKVRQRRLRKKLMKGEFGLTIRDQYFMRYCRKIAAGVWTEKDYIYAYDEELMRMVNIYNMMTPESPISRENMAKVLLAFVGNR